MNFLKLTIFFAVIIVVSARNVKFTYYWLLNESDYRSGSKDTEVKGCNGKVLTKVTKDFAKNLKLECSGLLLDGRILNGGNEQCTCFNVVDAPKGSKNNNLVPFVSIACNDEDFGTKCYVKELNGLKLPTGETHNGCVRVDDVSWSFGKNHIDFYAYKKAYYEYCRKQVDNKVDFTCPSSCTLKKYKY